MQQCYQLLFAIFSFYHSDSSAQLQLALLLKYFKVLTSDTVTHSPAERSTQTPEQPTADTLPSAAPPLHLAPPIPRGFTVCRVPLPVL